MPTTNIGPCECCGGTENCPCSTCLYQWLDYGSGFAWQIIDLCGGGDGSSEPCCDCPAPVGQGSYDGEPQQQNCTQGSGTNKCNCTACIAQWNAFTEQWEVYEACKAGNGTLYPSCRCIVPTIPGTQHGKRVGVTCGCPAT